MMMVVVVVVVMMMMTLVSIITDTCNGLSPRHVQWKTCQAESPGCGRCFKRINGNEKII